jgi:hypothetical protein
VILFRKAIEIELAVNEKKVAHKTKVGRLYYGIKKHCATEIKIVAIVILIALILSLVACFTNLDIPTSSSQSLVSTPTPTPFTSNTPYDISFVTPQSNLPPSPTPVYLTTYLSELDPIIEKSDAFITKSWNAFDDFIVGQDTIQHGIGIEIPEKDLSTYLKKSNNKRVQHIEYIEYSLGRKYEQIDFEFGIDRSSFESLQSDAPVCLCRIVMQDVPSNGFVNESSNILFDSDWFNYRLARHAASIAVQKVETLRITVYWEFDVNPTKDASLRLVLIDPELHILSQ